MAVIVLALTPVWILSQLAEMLAAVSLTEMASVASLLGALSARASATDISVTLSVYGPLNTLRASISLNNELLESVIFPLFMTPILVIVNKPTDEFSVGDLMKFSKLSKLAWILAAVSATLTLDNDTELLATVRDLFSEEISFVCTMLTGGTFPGSLHVKIMVPSIFNEAFTGGG